ncbi:MAG: hypothetical protein PF692_14440 [Kiritimatiellae bacterium]|jgi:hypothetical protein|nr:hypothetical protein [Kiritimatiellia bacterium]
MAKIYILTNRFTVRPTGSRELTLAGYKIIKRIIPYMLSPLPVIIILIGICYWAYVASEERQVCNYGCWPIHKQCANKAL